LRLSIRKPDVLRFLCDLTVPFTNNLAEQAARIRMGVAGLGCLVAWLVVR
jgi:hypothetical protein